MIKLTIRPQIKRKNRFSVFLDDEYLFSISQYTYRKLGEPACLTVESVEQFRMECVFPEQYNYCLDLLSRRGYSTKELRDKLFARGVTEEMTEEILNRLTEEKLISDEDFKESFVRSRQTYHKQGFYKIRQELSRRGVSLSREDYDAQAELANLAELVAKLLGRKVEPKKIIQRLLAKGFRYGDIVSTLKEQALQTEEEQTYEEYNDYES